jgi:hypothetical protein
MGRGWGRSRMHIEYLWENQKKDQDLGEWIILKWILER